MKTYRVSVTAFPRVWEDYTVASPRAARRHFRREHSFWANDPLTVETL